MGQGRMWTLPHGSADNKMGQLKMFLSKHLHFDVFKETSLRGL